jgi:hypothetical protein
MVNRESLPLIGALLVPIVLVSIILLYFYGYDLTLLIREVPIIYYIIIFPIALGFSVGIIKVMRSE